MRILNIDTPEALVKQWATWLAPHRQPFFLADHELPELQRGPRLNEARLAPEIRDTFGLWGVNGSLRICWLDEPGFNALPRQTRAQLVRAQHVHGRSEVPSVRAWRHLVPEAAGQADGHRFVWWPSLLEGREPAVLVPIVSDRLLPSRHREVGDAIWRTAERLLPNARSLAGKWAETTGPNCFGTVMAAAGVHGAEAAQMPRAPFEEFLATRTRPGGRDDQPGTVLLWRSADGLSQHAAVTLGSGYALHKPAQGWYAPRKILTVREVVKVSRTPGWRVSRRHLIA